MLSLMIYWRGVLRQVYGRKESAYNGPSASEWAAFKRRMTRKTIAPAS